MAIDRPSEHPQKKGVSKPKSPRLFQKITEGRLARAALIASTMGTATGAVGIPLAMEGCAMETNESLDEHIGHTPQALASGVNTPTTPSLGILSNSKVAYVERSGLNITLYTVYDNGGNYDIYKVGTTDGINWNSPSPTAVPGANSAQMESDFKVCGPNAYVVSGKDGISDKLYMGSWSGGTVGPLSAVPGTLNNDGATVGGVACNSSATKIYATSDVLSSNLQILSADIGTWTWSPLSSCSNPTKDTWEMFVDTNDFYISSDRSGTLGSLDLMVYNGTWNGTNCSGPATNLNAIPGSATINDPNTQGGFYFDSVGDLWYSDNGTVKWATKIPGGADAGADADSGSDAAPDAMDGGTDASDAADATDGDTDAGDAGVDAAPDAMDGGTDADAAGDASDASDGGAGGAGGSSITPDTGPDGAGGTGGGPVTPDAGPGGSGGAGGSVPIDCKIAQKIANPEDFKIDNCTATEVDAHVTAPATVKLGDKTVTFTEGSGTITFTMPNQLIPSLGLAFKYSEDPQSQNPKMIYKVDPNSGFAAGIFLGAEGTTGELGYPDAINPDKSKKIYQYVEYSTLDGDQKAYVSTCKPENNSLNKCDLVKTTAQGANTPGDIPKGTAMFQAIPTGELSGTEPAPNKVDPVTTPKEGGCGCTTVGEGVEGTRENLAGLATVLGLGIIAARRKKNGSVEVETSK